jgi:hypothetical protein
MLYGVTMQTVQKMRWRWSTIRLLHLDPALYLRGGGNKSGREPVVVRRPRRLRTKRGEPPTCSASQTADSTSTPPVARALLSRLRASSRRPEWLNTGGGAAPSRSPSRGCACPSTGICPVMAQWANPHARVWTYGLRGQPCLLRTAAKTSVGGTGCSAARSGPSSFSRARHSGASNHVGGVLCRDAL